MPGDLRMSPFDVIDGTLIVPCNPGHIELRLENGMLVIQRWVFVRPMMGVAGHSQMIASMRIPLDAVRALESALGQPPMSNGPGGSAASTQVSAQTRTPEESPRSSSEDTDQPSTRTVGRTAKESASPGRPGRAAAGGLVRSTPTPGARPPVVDPTEKKEAGSGRGNPESGGEAGAPSSKETT